MVLMNRQSSVIPAVESLPGSEHSSISEDEGEDRTGIWRRRRLLDGSLNRVPSGFYTRMWLLLERCQGLSVQVIFTFIAASVDLVSNTSSTRLLIYAEPGPILFQSKKLPYSMTTDLVASMKEGIFETGLTIQRRYNVTSRVGLCRSP